MNRTARVAAVLAMLALPLPALAAPIQATLYKDPQCGCCEAYAAYLQANGFKVEVKPTLDVSGVARKAGVPVMLEACHTIFVEGYVVEGHVPIGAVRKLLEERPAVAGIALPGMPPGSPGMPGPKRGPLVVYAFSGTAAPTVFARE